jgi:hypothetical protein
MRVAPYAIQFSEHSSRLSETLSVTLDVMEASGWHRQRYWRRALLVGRSVAARLLDRL